MSGRNADGTDRIEKCRICGNPRPKRELDLWETGPACEACLTPVTSEELESAFYSPGETPPHVVMRLAFMVHVSGHMSRMAQRG